MDFVAIIVGLMLLIKGGDLLLDAAVDLSLKINIPKIVIGMTVVSFATSAPELIVSIKSALMGYPDLALGNVVGSNVANLAFVLGVVLIISPIRVTKSFYKTDWPIMMIATLLFYFFLQADGYLNQVEGGILFVLLLIFLIYLIFFQKKAVFEEKIEINEKETPLTQLTFTFFIGGFFFVVGFRSSYKFSSFFGDLFGRK